MLKLLLSVISHKCAIKMSLRLVLILVMFIKVSQPANILCVYPTVSHSHFLFAERLLIELSQRGHNVTVISQYVKPVSSANYNAIVIPVNKDLSKMMNVFTDNAGDKLIVLRGLLGMSDVLKGIMRQALDHPDLLKTRRDKNIDLLITEAGIGDSMLALAMELNCPSIQIASFPPVLSLFERMGNPLSISYVPNTYLSSSGEPMGFVTRVINFITALFEMGVFKILTSMTSSVYREYFPAPDYPTLDELRHEVSLIMINTHFSQGIVRPLVPGIIELSGVHIKQTSPLPNDLAEFMDNSQNGVILFSLGTIVKSSKISKPQMDILLDTFQNLKQNVLWKLDDDQIKSLPRNVKISKWLPQNDLLAHSNLKMFITHGGLGSIIEAKYHGVPLILMPVFGDQIGNSEQVVSEGWGRSLIFNNLNARDFQEAVRDVLTNSSYRERVQNLSLLYRDRPQTPMETAMYWVEYVLRHKGATHMKSNARHLNFWQLHSIDVIGFLLTILVIVSVVFYIFIKLLLKILCQWNINKMKKD